MTLLYEQIKVGMPITLKKRVINSSWEKGRVIKLITRGTLYQEKAVLIEFTTKDNIRGHSGLQELSLGKELQCYYFFDKPESFDSILNLNFDVVMYMLTSLGIL